MIGLRSSRSFDFSEGYVAQNIISALTTLPPADLAMLYAHNDLHFSKNAARVISRDLYYASLDAYAMATGHTLRYFLFGSEEMPLWYCSELDSYVIQILDMLTDTQLITLKDLLLSYFRTPLMDICMDIYRMGMQLLQN